ncbi:hypothetical protein M0R45_013030 [Rubus argutus]|uniref:FYVE zinc finger domain-containing protein n=1 Tax=Rubus argutus TaxID=59490 RepID=A0AAW1XH07_RUBAR
MLEKIGLPAKPSLRGNNWVVDASHCQGCSSQFTFIIARCGGIFCGSCTQQRMFLRGQGDSPVRVCEPCKKLEEAARFERYGHKTRAARGSSKLTSKPEDEILNQILVMVERNQDKSLDEKKKYKILKGEGKSAEALEPLRKGRKLERQADALEISLRKKRKKDLLSENVAESQIKDDPSQSGRRNRVTPVGREKDDLSVELKELGWSDLDLRDEEKKTSENCLAEAEESDDEISALIRSMDDDKEEFSIQYEQEDGFNFDSLINAADDHIIDNNFESDRRGYGGPRNNCCFKIFWVDSDSNNPPETSVTQIASFDKEALLTEIQSLKREALTHKRAGNVTEAMAQLKKAKLLEGDLESIESQEGNVVKTSRNSFICKLLIEHQSHLWWMKKALALRREGRLDEAEEELKRGRVLEHQLEEMENGSMLKATPVAVGSKDSVLEHEHANVSGRIWVGIDDDNEVANSSSEPYKQIDTMQAGESPPAQAPGKIPLAGSRRSKSEIQRELLGLKRKALALRRQGDTEEAEEMLKKAKALEDQIVEMEAPKKKVESDISRHKDNFIDPLNVIEEEGDGGDVTENDMQDPALLSVLRVWGGRMKSILRKGQTVEAEEVLKMAKVLEVQIEELEAPKGVHLHDYAKEEKPGSTGLLMNTEKQGSLKDNEEVGRSIQVEVGCTDEGIRLSADSGSKRNHAVNPPLMNPNFLVPPTSQLLMELGNLGEPGYPDNQRIAQGTIQSSPAQSGNFTDLLTGDDWRGSPGSAEKQYDSLTDTVVANERRDAKEANLVQGSCSQKNESATRQEILAFKRRALALKREGKLTEAREELRQAKVLEKRLEEDSPQSKTS